MNHIIYIDRTFDSNMNTVEIQCKSKVYGTFSAHYPSGVKKMAHVWSKRLNKIVAIRLDHDLVSIID
jgi:hypothetical protein